MRTADVAAYARVSPRTVRKWFKEGLRHLKLSHKNLLFRKEWVDEFLLRHECSASRVETLVDKILAEM